MADFQPPQEFLFNLLVSIVQTISNRIDAVAAFAITIATLGTTLCFLGWLIRTGRIPVSSRAGIHRPRLVSSAAEPALLLDDAVGTASGLDDWGLASER